MVSMCFSCTVCWGEIGTGKSLVVWVDTAGCTQAEALGSVQEEASQPEPWGGDHRKRPGDCIRVTVGSDLREDKLAGGMGIPGKNRQAFKKSKNQPQSIFRIQRTSPVEERESGQHTAPWGARPLLWGPWASDRESWGPGHAIIAASNICVKVNQLTRTQHCSLMYMCERQGAAIILLDDMMTSNLS